MKRDSRFYGLYWSADEHTHEFKLPKIIFLLPVMIAVFVGILYFILSGTMMEVVTGQPNPLSSSKSVDTPPSSPVVTSPTPPSSKPSKLFYVGTQVFDHPLTSMCTGFEYAGYTTVKINNIYRTEHFLNCFTDTSRLVNTVNSDGSTSQESELITRTLSSDYLKNLGYSIALNNRTPIIVYDGRQIVLEVF
jgi:zona occludens toxin